MSARPNLALLPMDDFTHRVGNTGFTHGDVSMRVARRRGGQAKPRQPLEFDAVVAICGDPAQAAQASKQAAKNFMFDDDVTCGSQKTGQKCWMWVVVVSVVAGVFGLLAA